MLLECGDYRSAYDLSFRRLGGHVSIVYVWLPIRLRNVGRP